MADKWICQDQLCVDTETGRAWGLAIKEDGEFASVCIGKESEVMAAIDNPAQYPDMMRKLSLVGVTPQAVDVINQAPRIGSVALGKARARFGNQIRLAGHRRQGAAK